MSHPKTPTHTVESILGALTQERVELVNDAVVKRELQGVLRFATGVATVLLAGESDAKHEALARQLGEVHVTIDDVEGIVRDANSLLAKHEEKVAKEAQFHAMVAEVGEASHEIHEHLAGYANLLRGKLGSKSDQLARFGVAALIPGKRHPQAPAKGPTTSA